MTYQTEIEKTADGAATQVLAAVAAWQAGQISTEALTAVVAAYITAAKSTTTALADLSLAAVLTAQTGQAVAPLGITVQLEDADRLQKAAGTLAALEDASPDRWARLARAEALEAASRAYSEGIARSPRVTGWTRGLSANACQLCQWWSRDGQVWPADHPMPTHKGCTCNPIPTT